MKSLQNCRKQWSIILSAVFVFFVLTACAAQTPAPEETRTETGKYQIAWYATAPHPFFEDVRIGIEAFEKDYGIEVKKQVGPDWNPENEVENFEALEAKGYKLFSIYPTGSSEANELYADLIKKDCRIVNFGAQMAEPSKAEFYVGTDIQAAAEKACEELIRSMGGEGNLVNVLEVLEDANTIIRKKAIEKVVARHPKVKIIEEIGGINTVEEAVQKINDSLSRHMGETDGIIATGDTTSVGIAQVLTDFKKQGGSKTIHAVGISTDPIVVKAIREGIMDATISQNPYGMGYLSCLLLKYLQDGWKPKSGQYTRIDTGFVIATKNNLDHMQNQMILDTRKIQEELEARYLSK